jgi:hypothetical protein
MTIEVSDSRSNSDEQVEHAVKAIGKWGGHKARVFDFVYRGKKQWKGANQISVALKLPITRVLDAGLALKRNGIVVGKKEGGVTFYGKDAFFSGRRNKIISLLKNPKLLEKIPTKRRPKMSGESQVILRVPAIKPMVQELTVDDIDSFAKVKSISQGQNAIQISEKKFKLGVQKIIGEKGKFQDWGGEPNDLLTTRIKIKDRRISTAFAFKGPGKKGILTIAKMGKNGDQIQRLFKSPAQFFILQYWE